MADQVNPMGGLSPGVLNSIQAQAPVPRTASDRTPSAPVPGFQAKRPGERRLDPTTKSPEDAVKDINAYLKQSGSDLRFSVDQASGLSYFQVVNSKTHEVIRQVPSEEVLAMARKLQQMAKQKDPQGVLLDQEG